MVDRARRAILLSVATLAATGALPGPARANDQQLIVDRARIVVESFLGDPDFQQMRVYVQNAYGVLIIPDLLKGGLFVGVAIPASSEGLIQISPFQLLMGDPTIVFSAVGTVQDMRELVDLAARGVVRTHVSRTGALSELDDIFEELADARYLGRAVITDLTR